MMSIRLLITCLLVGASAYTYAVQELVEASGEVRQLPGGRRQPPAATGAHGSGEALEVGLVETHKVAADGAKSSEAAAAKTQTSQDEMAATTTPSPNGTTSNEVGDFLAFVTAVVLNSATICVCLLLFNYLRHKYPIIYAGNVKEGIAPRMLESREWYNTAWDVSVDEVAQTLGLDQAMLLEFTRLSIRVFSLLSVVVIPVLGGLHLGFGGNAAGMDHLSYLSFGNVQKCGADRTSMDFHGCWLYYIHAFVIWGVVVTVQVSVYKAMKDFLPKRYKWLKEMPEPRSTTLLVTGIPESHQSDDKLKTFFAGLFGAGKIKSVYVTKCSPTLETVHMALESATKGLRENEAKWKHVNNDPSKKPKYKDQDAIEYFTAEVERQKAALKSEKAKFKEVASNVGGCNCDTGFITFASKADAEIALNLQYDSDKDVMALSTPPEPDSILWKDLQQDSTAGALREAIGYGLIAGLYFLYLPIVISVTNIAKNVNMGPLQPLWAGLAPTMGLQFMVAFLPTILLAIFRICFTLVADPWSQKMLQNSYFAFQVVFVILATAVGTDVKAFTNTLATEPFAAFGVLADSMPAATHFYMNFLVLQWVTHATNLTRFVTLGKFLLFSRIYDEKEAKAMAEPEDQDYYGMGSRSARFTINFCIGIVFGTLSPPVNLLTLVNFIMCRLVYGYLIPFAETKKADLGGAFFVTQLKHIFVGNIIYCVLMIGVLLRRSENFGPVIIAAPSIVYVIWSMKRFETMFSWEKLPFTEAVSSEKSKAKDSGHYYQAEYM